MFEKNVFFTPSKLKNDIKKNVISGSNLHLTSSCALNFAKFKKRCYGFVFRVKQSSYDHFDANDTTFSAKFGKDFNGGATNISVMEAKEPLRMASSRWSWGAFP